MDHQSSESPSAGLEAALDVAFAFPRTTLFLLSASLTSIAFFSSFKVGVDGGLTEDIG